MIDPGDDGASSFGSRLEAKAADHLSLESRPKALGDGNRGINRLIMVETPPGNSPAFSWLCAAVGTRCRVGEVVPRGDGLVRQEARLRCEGDRLRVSVQL